MKKITITCLITVFMLCLSIQVNAQDAKKEQIAKAVTDYFFLERENIHAHFDKNVFMTNENIWFKGYVYHRKNATPFFNTINIYAALLNSEGTILETQLLYGNMGTFSGMFKLNDTLKSGKYYIQFYTNWMNNFTEDESAVYEVAVINKGNNALSGITRPDYSKINITLNPEGGNLLRGAVNSVGITIADCNNNPIPVSEADIIDSAGKLYKKIQINKLGFGRFDLPASDNLNYKAVITFENKKYEQQLPTAQLKGITLEINNYAVANKIITKIRTNAFTLAELGNKPLYLLVHQDEAATIYDINFAGKLEQTLILSNDILKEGVNSIRVIDADMKQLAERMVYKYPTEVLVADIKKTKVVANNYEIAGKTSNPNMALSISVLPEGTISMDNTNDIYGSFLIAPYIKSDRKTLGKYYLSPLSKGKHYELDLYLLNQKNKYNWTTIVNSPPKDNYPFDMGLNIRGSLGLYPGSHENSKIRMYSLTAGLEELTDVTAKNEFYFNNTILRDSAYVNFTQLRKGIKPKELQITPQILNGGRKFYKMHKPVPVCETTATANDATATTFEIPQVYSDVTELEEVKIEGTTLKYANSFGNSNLRGYKITDSQSNMYQNILNFIKTYGGFNVEDRSGDVTIYSRTVSSINGAQSSPIIYIDHVQQLDHNILRNIQMTEVDEIYMSPHAIVPSVRNFLGMIKIYLKKGVVPRSKNTTPQIMIKGGFTKIYPFTNINYSSTSDKGFQNFGIIQWEPTLITNENGEFTFKIPKTAQKTVKVLIEGFSIDGKLISEIKTMVLE